MFAELHAAILEDLDADGPRLVLADALQAVGDPRGELIAVQCELARLGCDRTRVALWKSPDAARSSLEATRRADWIGDALVTGEAQVIARLRRREKTLLSRHEATWIGGAQLPGHRFGRGFIDHLRAGRDPDLANVFRLHVRSLELARAAASTVESSLLAQCRQLRVTLAHPAETAALIDRLGGIGVPGAPRGGVHGELVHLRELAVAGLTDGPDTGRSELGATASALDRLIAAPGFARLEALDLYDQPFDAPERIAQILTAARLRDLRLGLNVRSSWSFGSQPAIHEVLARTPAAASLEVLDLFYAGTENALASLVVSPHLQQLRALRIVTGSSNRTFEGAARAVGDGLPELRVLDVRYSPFVRFLQDLVGGRGLGRLTQLGLRGCSLDDTSVRQLADSPRFEQLRIIDLRDNLITDKGAKALAARGPGRLERLELGGNALTVKGRDLLNARFPDATIEIGRPRR